MVVDEIAAALKHRKIVTQTHKCEELPGLPGDHSDSESSGDSSGAHMRHSVLVAVMDNPWVESVGGRRDLLAALLCFHRSTELAPKNRIAAQAWLGRPFIIAVDMR